MTCFMTLAGNANKDLNLRRTTVASLIPVTSDSTSDFVGVNIQAIPKSASTTDFRKLVGYGAGDQRCFEAFKIFNRCG